MKRAALLILVLGAGSGLGACGPSSGAEDGCTQLRPDQAVYADVGGSVLSQSELASLMEFSAVASTTSLELTSICTQIASELGTPQAAIDAALSGAEQDDRVTAACKLATDALVGGHAMVVITPVACAPAPQVSCLKSCTVTTKTCDDACTALSAAKADCREPPDVALHFGPILAMRARLGLMAGAAPSLAAATDSVTDIRAACIPYARDRARDATAHIASSQKAIEDLVDAAGH